MFRISQQNPREVGISWGDPVHGNFTGGTPAGVMGAMIPPPATRPKEWVEWKELTSEWMGGATAFNCPKMERWKEEVQRTMEAEFRLHRPQPEWEGGVDWWKPRAAEVMGQVDQCLPRCGSQSMEQLRQKFSGVDIERRADHVARLKTTSGDAS